MENELYEVPEHYLLCFNDNCSKAQTCLHRIVAQGNYIKDNVVNAVNPARFNETNCTYYAPNTPVRLAYGMLHIFDNVLARDIAAMRNELREHFGNGSYYLRRNGTLPIVCSVNMAIPKSLSSTTTRLNYNTEKSLYTKPFQSFKNLWNNFPDFSKALGILLQAACNNITNGL